MDLTKKINCTFSYLVHVSLPLSGIPKRDLFHFITSFSSIIVSTAPVCKKISSSDRQKIYIPQYILFASHFNHSGTFDRFICVVFGRSFGRSKTKILSFYDLCITLNLILTAINTVFLSRLLSLALKSSEQRWPVSHFFPQRNVVQSSQRVRSEFFFSLRIYSALFDE